MTTSSNEVIQKIRGIATSIVEKLAFELVDVIFRRESGAWVLRIVIDKPEGITLDDCAVVSQEMGQRMDVEDLISYAYHLEVASPGLDRPLKRPEDFQRFSGRMIKITTKEPVENTKHLKGRLLESDKAKVIIEIQKKKGNLKQIEIPLNQIHKANLEIELP